MTVFGLIEEGKAVKAKEVATYLETAVREAIPEDIFDELKQVHG